MGGGWAARLVLCIAAAACLCAVCAGKDPVTLHRIVTSTEGCGPDRAKSAEQCKQFAAAGVQLPGNVSNRTSTYKGGNAPSMFPLGCACSDGSVYFRFPQHSTAKDEPCSMSYPCICEFLPALDNCTQGTFFNTTINTTIRCTMNAVTTPPESTINNMTVAGKICRTCSADGVAVIADAAILQLVLRRMTVCLLHGTDALTPSHPHSPFLSPPG